MPKVRTDQIVQLLLVCALILGAVLMLRLHPVSVSARDVGLQPSRAIQTYQQRVHATQVLLKTDRLVSSR